MTVVVTLGSSRPAAATLPMDLTTRWSCAPSSIYVDPSAPADVLDAVEQWHTAFRPDWTFTSSPDAAVRLYMRTPFVEGAGGDIVISGTATERTGAVIEIDPMAGGDAGNLARHELGHVAGLDHNPDRTSAMSPTPLRHRYGVSDLVGMRVAAGMCR